MVTPSIKFPVAPLSPFCVMVKSSTSALPVIIVLPWVTVALSTVLFKVLLTCSVVRLSTVAPKSTAEAAIEINIVFFIFYPFYLFN